MRNFRQITPFLHVRELAPALTFFTRILGFAVTYRHGVGYAYLERDGVGIRILESEEAVPGPRAFRVYIDVHDVGALFAELAPALATLPAGDWFGPRDQSYGQRELGVLMPDGGVLVFGQPIDRPSPPTGGA